MNDLGPETQRLVGALEPLFERARKEDEFEYVCALLRIRGMAPSSMDPLRESRLLLEQCGAFAMAPMDRLFKLRLGLLEYCHATEMDDLYHVPMNLLRIVEGGRYSLAPFHQGDKKEPKYPSGKVPLLAELARKVGFDEVAEAFETAVVSEIRNAFYHSDYTLSREAFVVCRGRPPVLDDNVRRPSVPLDWLIPRLELGINLALGVLHGLFAGITSYDKPVRIKAERAPSFGDVELDVMDGGGLIGFHTVPPDEA